jgi:hypothetical protein
MTRLINPRSSESLCRIGVGSFQVLALFMGAYCNKNR